MSFPYSRRNAGMSRNPYYLAPRPICANPNQVPAHTFATEIPYHSADTTYPVTPCCKPQIPLPLSAPNATMNRVPLSKYGCGGRPMNQTLEQLLERNASISNPYNKYPFYSDPSTMWSAPVTYPNTCM